MGHDGIQEEKESKADSERKSLVDESFLFEISGIELAAGCSEEMRPIIKSEERTWSMSVFVGLECIASK